MTMRMLIDARHREETRVAVVKGNRIEEFDFESAEHKQLKGNIYLAKVTRVEPSLQAAFVDYGGNRHGFLAFSEIHPDYYQIPKEDREALLREEAEHAAEEERLRDSHHDDDDDGLDGHHDDDGADHDRPDADFEGDDEEPVIKAESIGGEDDLDDEPGQDDNAAVANLRSKRMALRRRYKIQDVIHRRQVLLVQVVKEERGNKGAALTTYLSLAGRYCVLMPNTTHGGGISRKISNVADRKRLKSIMAELDLPSTMGCIVRTAGLQRTKTEIRRDFDYLARVWDGIRETTLKSAAPALINGDSDLIKRAIRDIYNRDIEEVIVEGEEGYRAAREYMKLLMPSHAKKVKPYADAVPLYQRYGAEDQLNAMYQPVVQLKSGGYLVINPTEALVSIDINSGRSTREYGIEQTAVGTNLEAAQEIARQLRLRDMAGLVVIDFIDMENNSNIRKVEKAMKNALANDRARIQIGRISSFGLMEMSRQRLRTGVLEASTRQCPHCEGTGLVRTASSAALSALRMLEDEAAHGKGDRLTLRTSQEASIYVLNRKRAELAEIEERYGVSIDIFPDGETEGARMTVDVSGPPPAYQPRIEPIAIIEEDDSDLPDDFEEDEVEAQTAAREPRDGENRAEGDAQRKRSRRRRGRRGRRDEGEQGEEGSETAAPRTDVASESDDAGDREASDEAPRASEDGGERKRSRRGRRGGRGRRGDGAVDAGTESADASATVDDATDVPEAAQATPVVADAPVKGRRRPAARKVEKLAKVVAEAFAAPVEDVTEAVTEKPKRSRKKAVPATESSDAIVEAAPEPDPVAVVEPVAEPEAAEKPKRRSRAKAKPDAESAAQIKAAPLDAAEVAATQAAGSNADPAEPPRRGWWQRTFGVEE